MAALPDWNRYVPDPPRSSTTRFARALAALGRAADRASDAINEAFDTDRRNPS